MIQALRRLLRLHPHTYGPWRYGGHGVRVRWCTVCGRDQLG